MGFLLDVLESIKPSAKELKDELEVANRLVEHIKLHVPPSCEVALTGSIAKKTFLRDKKDVDIFVLFPRSEPKEHLESKIKEIMESAFPSIGYQISYAEHPYIRFHYHGRKVDLVPAYKISKAAERLSAVNRSVLHTRFVRNSLKLGQTDEVLLLKQFLKANSLYGAEIKTKGFSGYLCELLIVKYGTFRKLAAAASRWKSVFIDIKKFYSSREAKEQQKRLGVFVVIDPTDKNRNVAAAVSEKNFKKFISLCRSFVKKPDKKFFLYAPKSFEQKLKAASRGKKLFLLSMPRPDVVDDVLWGQIHKLTKQLKDHLKDFEPSSILADDSRHVVRIAIILKKDHLPKKMLIQGPPLSMEKNVSDFRKSHGKARFTKKNKKIYAEIRRPVTKAEQAIMAFFRSFSKTRSHLAYPEEIIILERK